MAGKLPSGSRQAGCAIAARASCSGLVGVLVARPYAPRERSEWTGRAWQHREADDEALLCPISDLRRGQDRTHRTLHKVLRPTETPMGDFRRLSSARRRRKPNQRAAGARKFSSKRSTRRSSRPSPPPSPPPSCANEGSSCTSTRDQQRPRQSADGAVGRGQPPKIGGCCSTCIEGSIPSMMVELTYGSSIVSSLSSSKIARRGRGVGVGVPQYLYAEPMFTVCQRIPGLETGL